MGDTNTGKIDTKRSKWFSQFGGINAFGSLIMSLKIFSM